MRKLQFSFLLLFLSALITGYTEEDGRPLAFVAVGDTGCGCEGQEQVAKRLLEWHKEKPFQFVLMLGDNIYAKDYRNRGGSKNLFAERFDRHYQELTERGVKFHAVLGNHDMETNDGLDEIADKKRFNILGSRGYYSFSSDRQIDGNPLISFFAIHSYSLEENGEDPEQTAWLSQALTENQAHWKIAFFHHPFYSPEGAHKGDLEIREELENILVAAGVRVTLAGHNHFYARMKVQRGVVHFISGGGGRSLKTPKKDEETVEAVKAFHFLYMEVYPDNINFWAVPTSGPPIDQGAIARQES